MLTCDLESLVFQFRLQMHVQLRREFMKCRNCMLESKLHRAWRQSLGKEFPFGCLSSLAVMMSKRIMSVRTVFISFVERNLLRTVPHLLEM